MNAIYIPQRITTAAQAEALPIGTVAVLTVDDGTTLAAPKRSDGANGFWWDEGGSVGDEHMTGWTALVPIEAEEETRPDTSAIRPWGETTPDPLPEQARYVTRWEAS